MVNNAYTIKDLPENDRPRERLIKFGAEALSNEELLAIMIRTGTKNESAVFLANKIIKNGRGLNYLCSCTVQELSKIKGIGSAKAAQIIAAVELEKESKTSGEEI